MFKRGSCVLPQLSIAALLFAAILGGCTDQATNGPAGAAVDSIRKVVFMTGTQPPKVAAPVAVRTDTTTVTLDPAQAAACGLHVCQAQFGKIRKFIDCPGRVGPDAEQTRQVSTPSAGRASEVKAKLGDVVQEGQVMAIMKSDPIGQVQSDLLQNTLQARADIKQQEVQMKLSRVTYDRESTLYKEQVSAKADLQTAENQLEKDESNLASLKAKMDATIRVAQERLNLLGAPPDSARKVVATGKIDPWVIIRAPESGLVIDRQINPGELSDGSKPLFSITDLSEVWLFGDVYEKDIELVHKDQDAFVTVDSVPGRKFPAKIIWIGDSINPQTRTLPVRANVPNPNFLLKPGMFARMKVSVGNLPVLLVPASAVLQQGDKSLVFIQRSGNTFVQREVETGSSDKDNVEIVSGLKPGDRVADGDATALLGACMKATAGDD